MNKRLTLPCLVFSVLILPAHVRAQWQLNGAPVSTAVNPQATLTVVSDGAGGAIMAWEDYRDVSTSDIYAQRINSAGVAQWTVDGVAICTALGDAFFPKIASDGAGGAIITWQDSRSVDTDIYAQRINAAGTVQWAANGIALTTGLNFQVSPAIVADGAGGAVVAWQDPRTPLNSSDIYAQRVNALGAAQWTADGVVLCALANDQVYPQLISDGAAGAIVTWQDWRSSNYDVYAQRVNPSGAVQWTANGVALCIAAQDQYYPQLVSDGASGAIVAWYDLRPSTNYDIYAQRINAAGAIQWIPDGLAICTTPESQSVPRLASDGAGGAILAWADYRSGNSDIYAQRVTGSGAAQWPYNGVALCNVSGDQYNVAVAEDGSGGVVISWQDPGNGLYTDIYAQRVDASGVNRWAADGVAVCTAPGDQGGARIIADGAGGGIVAWFDSRSTGDIYAQRVELDFGAWGNPEPQLFSVSDVPKDQGGKVAVNWKRSGHDVLPLQEIGYYSIWRAVTQVSALGATGSADAWVVPASVGPDFQGTAFFHETIASADYYWEWVANQNASHDAGYSFAASTREDSVSGNTATHYFRVIAHTSNAYVLYKSGVMSGHSVDNLAPAAPLMLTAQRAGSDVHLQWNGVHVPDLRDYSVYRKTSAGVTPAPINLLASANDTVLVDAGAPSGALYYIVTAFDVHQNQGSPSNEASVGATTHVGNTPSIAALTVLQNYPNPFAGSTELEIGLPAAADVSVEVYDVAGRKVRARTITRQDAGWQKMRFDGRDDAGRRLANGVYFFRVSANGSAVTRKMVVAR